MIVQIDPSIIIFERKIQGLCKTPYYGHPKGCPNFGKKKGCPPKQPLIDKVFDFDQDMFVIYTSFEVGKFAERMRQEHPEWSEHPRQWYNPRRWQPTARKEHNEELFKFLMKYKKENLDYSFNTSPEAHGVNVTDLMSKIGIKLNWEWPPEHSLDNLTYRVSLGGSQKL